MTQHDPIETTNIDGYGADMIPWGKVRDLLVSDLSRPETAAFLGTARPDGRPHSAGIGPLYHDGTIFSTSGPTARKSRDLLANPACTLSLRVTGMDLVLDGTAARETDPLVLEAVAGAYRDGGWPAEVDDNGDALTAPYSAQTAGPPPWRLYRFTVATIVGLNLFESGGATRWRFAKTDETPKSPESFGPMPARSHSQTKGHPTWTGNSKSWSSRSPMSTARSGSTAISWASTWTSISA